MVAGLGLPLLALVLNAFVWGVSWWPLRELQAQGLHPLWSSGLTYLLGASLMLAFNPSVWAVFVANRSQWVLAAAAGFTMVGFNWGVAIADVIRVVLLFYLMPVWAVLLARLVLKEPIGVGAMGRVALALIGAVLVLSPDGQIGLPVPSNLGEALGLMGGIAFALNNIMLRHQAELTAQDRLFGMFAGGVVVPTVVALGLALLLGGDGQLIQWPSMPAPSGLILLPAFALLLLVANYGLQFGASRLPANITAVVMLSEVVFATLSAIALTDERLTMQVALGGALILLAAGLSALQKPR